MKSADFDPHIVRITVVFGNPHRHRQAGQTRRQLHFRPILRDSFHSGRIFKIVRHIRRAGRSPTALTYWAWPRTSRRVLYRSCFPHSESTFPRSRQILSEILEGVPDDEQARIVGLNTARMYKFDVARLTGPR